MDPKSHTSFMGLSHCRTHFQPRSEAAPEMLGWVWWAHEAVSLGIGNQSANWEPAYITHKWRQTTVLDHRKAIPEHMTKELRCVESAQRCTVSHSQKHCMPPQKPDADYAFPCTGLICPVSFLCATLQNLSAISVSLSSP